jgi:hypothetical protein
MTQISKEQNSLLNKRVHEIQTQLGQVDVKVSGVAQDLQLVKTDVNGTVNVVEDFGNSY